MQSGTGTFELMKCFGVKDMSRLLVIQLARILKVLIVGSKKFIPRILKECMKEFRKRFPEMTGYFGVMNIGLLKLTELLHMSITGQTWYTMNKINRSVL